MNSARIRMVPLFGAPWSRHDAVTALALVAVGGLIWFVGWWQVAHEVRMGDQIVPLNIAIAGLVLTGAGQAWFFLRGRRTVRARRQLLVSAYRVWPALQTTAVDDRYIGGPRFYHRTDCAMTSGRDWVVGSREEQEREGRTACGVCAP